MELIKIINDIKDGLKNSGIITDDIVVIKDETTELDDIYREHSQNYIGYIQILNIKPNMSGNDKLVIMAGVYGVSSTNNEDYLQVVAKSAYILKDCMRYVGYTKDNDLNEGSFVIDGTKIEDTVKILTYTSLDIDIRLAYGSNV